MGPCFVSRLLPAAPLVCIILLLPPPSPSSLLFQRFSVNIRNRHTGWVNLNETLGFPPSWKASHYPTVDSLNQKFHSHDRPHWFANVLDMIPNLVVDKKQRVAREKRGGYQWPSSPSVVLNSGSNWWSDVLYELIKQGYAKDPKQLVAGASPWLVGTSVLKRKAAPVSLSGAGYMKHANTSLLPAVLEMQSMQMEAFDGVGGTVEVEIQTLLDGAGVSSAFWAANIVDSSVAYELGETTLIHLTTPSETAATALSQQQQQQQQQYYGMDGGLTDTTGIVNLLRRRASRIIAFYVVNHDLADVNCTIGYLFGRQDCTTDPEDCWGGPTLSQVFPSDLYEDTIAKLKDPTVLHVRHRNVLVMPNAFFGVEPYVMDDLLIISNQYAEAFVSGFSAPVKKAIDKDWPNKYAVGMTTFDANLLCMFQWWKIDQMASTIRAVLAGNATKGSP